VLGALAERSTPQHVALSPVAARLRRVHSAASGERGFRDETRPVSTGEGTRRAQLVRGEGRDISALYGREGGAGVVPGDREPPTRPHLQVWGSPPALQASRGLSLRASAAARRERERSAPQSGQYGGRDETCRISTGGGTRHIQSVREGGGGAQSRRRLRAEHEPPPHAAHRPLRS